MSSCDDIVDCAVAFTLPDCTVALSAPDCVVAFTIPDATACFSDATGALIDTYLAFIFDTYGVLIYET